MSKKSQYTYAQKPMPAEIQESFREIRILARASVRRIEDAEGFDVSLVWRILHEQSRYAEHSQRVQALTLPDHRARTVFCNGFSQNALQTRNL
jgi:hypothetical protein